MDGPLEDTIVRYVTKGTSKLYPIIRSLYHRILCGGRGLILGPQGVGRHQCRGRGDIEVLLNRSRVISGGTGLDSDTQVGGPQPLSPFMDA